MRAVVVAILAMTGCDLVIDLAPREERCPATFSERGYLVVSTKVTYEVAEAACRELPTETPGRFAHLIVLGDSVEGADLSLLGGTEPWVGLNDRRAEDEHHWITHEETGPIPWDVLQPNESPPPQDCAVWTPTGLHDKDCAETHVYVCECDAYEVDLDLI